VEALVTYAPFKMAFEQRPEPHPGPGEVVIRTQSVCICGSDVHLYRGDHPYRTYPMIFGHEASGVVERVGDGVTGLAPSDPVVVEPLIPCGGCYPCRIGRRNCCSRMRTVGVTTDGALAELFVVPAHCVYRLPAGLSPSVAALAEPFSIGFQAAARGEIAAADRVVVLGAGPIGLTTLAAAKVRGAQVAVADLLDARLAFAKGMGADLTINSDSADPVRAVLDWTEEEGASVVVEAVGLPQTLESTIRLVADAGRVVIVGVTERKFCLRGVDVTRKELTISGSRNNLGRFQEAVDFVAGNTALAGGMITHSYPFKEAIAAFEKADQHPSETCKVVIDFGV
jgi:threonine dehydrogenase-like Zn-dependent dehydrogenase